MTAPDEKPLAFQFSFAGGPELSAALDKLSPRMRDIGVHILGHTRQPRNAALAVVELLEGGYDVSPPPMTYLVNYNPYRVTDRAARSIIEQPDIAAHDDRDFETLVRRIEDFAEQPNAINAPRNARGNPADSALLFRYFKDIYASVEEDGPQRYRVTTHQGGRIFVARDKISFENIALDDHAAYAATVKLIGQTWGGGEAFGPKEHQLMAIAHGQAHGVKITGKDEAKFTAADRLRLDELYHEAMSFKLGKPNPTTTTAKPAPSPA